MGFWTDVRYTRLDVIMIFLITIILNKAVEVLF